MTMASDRWGIQEGHSKRAAALAAMGFTERQSRFLLMVLEHSGVFVERQYCGFAGIAHGQKSHNFIDRLTGWNCAREIQPGPLHRGRLYHVHYKPLYEAIGQGDNRNRKRAPMGRMVERLMLLDPVLDDHNTVWLATEKDKQRYFALLLHEHKARPEELPHLVFGTGARKTLRLFPEKLPIGIDPSTDRHVFVYLITRSAPVDFRAFLVRHFTLLTMLHRWTIRVLVPKQFAKSIRVYEHAIREELMRPLRPSEADELGWYFRQLQAADRGARQLEEARFRGAVARFQAPRFSVLYRLWKHSPTDVLWNTSSRLLADKFERGEASVEFSVLSRQYLHLSHLVGVA